MAEYKLRIAEPRPFFAELPYYVWGQVNYDSEGDCRNPLDRDWTWMELTHRDTDEQIDVSSEGGEWVVAGPDPTAARIAYFLQQRCGADAIGAAPGTCVGDWDHQEAMNRAVRVAAEFENERLAPFAEGHMFWGSWKWIGWFGTEFTWVGRWIMDSVVRDDPRGVELCISWLRAGTVAESQSVALRYALGRLTGLTFSTDREWVRWYDTSGKVEFPEPDIDEWFADMKAIHGGE